MPGRGRHPNHALAVTAPKTPRRAKTLLGPARAMLERVKAVARTPLLERDADAFAQVETTLLCDRVRDRLQDRADAKGVEIVHRCACKHVRVQPLPFSEALYELTDNAVAAAAPGNPVVLEVCGTPQGDVLWHIHDSGEGMSEHDLRELGLPRLSAGHGVVLAWAIVEHHGGLLHFESAPGGGTTATIWLPG